MDLCISMQVVIMIILTTISLAQIAAVLQVTSPVEVEEEALVAEGEVVPSKIF